MSDELSEYYNPNLGTWVFPPADRSAYMQAATPPADPPASSNPLEPAPQGGPVPQLPPDRRPWQISIPPDGLMNSPLVMRATDLSHGEPRLLNREALAQRQAAALAEMQRQAAAQQAMAEFNVATQAQRDAVIGRLTASESTEPVAAGDASFGDDGDDASDSAAYASVAASLAHTSGYMITDPEALIRLRDQGLISDASVRRGLLSGGSSIPLNSQYTYGRSLLESGRHQRVLEVESGRYLCCMYFEDHELRSMQRWPRGFRVEAADTRHRDRVELWYHDMLIEILDIPNVDAPGSSFVSWCNSSPANWVTARQMCGRPATTLAINGSNSRSSILDRPAAGSGSVSIAAPTPTRSGQRVVRVDVDTEVQDS